MTKIKPYRGYGRVYDYDTIIVVFVECINLDALQG